MAVKISLIMSVYNGSSHLGESIESILSQTFRDFEFVIIDDASTDETPQILSRYAAQDSRIVLLRNDQNLGLTKSLNKAIRASSGTYIARMDAGDTSEPTRFERQAAFLDANPGHVLVGSWAIITDENGDRTGNMKYPTDDAALRNIAIRYNPFVHSSLMMRRSAIESAGLYDERWRYAQDYELIFRMLQQGKAALIGEYLVSYRTYPNSITQKKNKQQTLQAMQARIQAIRRKQYSIWSYIWLIRPLIGYLLPYAAKQALKKKIS